MDTGRFIAKVSGSLRKTYKEKGYWDLQAMKDYDFQPYFPLSEILKTNYKASVNKDEIIVVIDIYKGMIGRLNKIITGFWLEAILLYGDLAKSGTLRIDNEVSPIYDIHLQKKSVCKLSLFLPSKKTSWIVLLKVGCMEGKDPAYHARHYGMKVLLTGRTSLRE